VRASRLHTCSAARAAAADAAAFVAAADRGARG
jgi:hypothetical protein